MKFRSLVDWIWIDLDDTLQDFHANSHQALLWLYGAARLDRWHSSPEAWVECYMRHNAALWALYNVAAITKDELRHRRFTRPLIEGGCPVDTADFLSASLDVSYLDFLAQGRIMIPGAIELLDHIKAQGYHIGILSNGFKEVQYRKIKTAGIESYIDLVVLSDDIGINKPDARIFNHALKLANSSPSRTLMIGDNPSTDIDGAINAGWHAIHFNRDGQGTPHPSAIVVNTLADIIPFL